MGTLRFELQTEGTYEDYQNLKQKVEQFAKENNLAVNSTFSE